MEHTTKEAPSLLTLADKCLLDIFKFLEFKDCAELADSCIRLRDVARLNKFKKINIYTATRDFGFDSKNMVSKDEFIKIMSMIGEHVETLHIFDGLNVVFEIIADKCKNLKILKITSSIWQKPIQIRSPYKLEKFKLDATFDENFRFFPDSENNITDLDLSEAQMNFMHYEQREGFLELLARLPKLKSLNMGYAHNFYYFHSHEFMLCTKGIINFTFFSKDNVNYLLKKLLNLNLVKLCFQMELNATSFDIMQQFQNLEELVVVHDRDLQEMQFPESAIFPPKLKSVKMENIHISWSKLSSIVENCKYLELVDLGSSGRILFDDAKCKYFPNEEADAQKNLESIFLIETHLQRALTIKYSNKTMNQQYYVYNSRNLKVINSWIQQKPKEKVERIFLKLDSDNLKSY